jgi:hypothetical protein
VVGVVVVRAGSWLKFGSMQLCSSLTRVHTADAAHAL